ncbi:MAG: glycosyltransferase family 4 protein [Candidatus Eisenbacteria bacterium]|nr:glycosyltransferase family 4 protein [Candidatus Eisenbacteria bacterium]
MKDSKIPMRIAMIGQKGIPATYGGIERHVEEVGKRLTQRGHEVYVYSRAHYTKVRGRYQGIHLIRLPSVNTKHLDTASHCMFASIDMIFRNFDIVHFHALGPSVFSLLPRIFGKKSVVTIHGLDWQRQKWGQFASWILKRCEYPAIRFPNRTIVVSKTLRDYFGSKFSTKPDIIPNGTNLPVFREASKIRRKYKLEPGDFILFVGRLVPEKGCHYLIEAFNKVATSKKLVFAGGSSFSDSYARELKKSESEKIRFLDYVYGDELEELWSNAYIVAQPSTLEGLSISLLEAMSYGRCIVTSDIPENLEVVGDNAVPFKSGDPDDLSQKLELLLGNEELVRSYEKRTKQFVTEKYSWEKIVDSTEAIYKEILSAK